MSDYDKYIRGEAQMFVIQISTGSNYFDMRWCV